MIFDWPQYYKYVIFPLMMVCFTWIVVHYMVEIYKVRNK